MPNNKLEIDKREAYNLIHTTQHEVIKMLMSKRVSKSTTKEDVMVTTHTP